MGAALALRDQTSKPARLGILLGNASYSLYLTHAFVMIGYARLLKTSAIGSVNQVFIVPLVILVAVAIGVLTHLLVEQPLLAVVQRLIRRSSRILPIDIAPPA